MKEFGLGQKKRRGEKGGSCSFQVPVGAAALNCVRLEPTEEEHESIVGATITNRGREKMILSKNLAGRGP